MAGMAETAAAPRNPMVSTAGKKQANGGIRHMHIEPADNGVVAETHYHAPKGQKPGPGYISDYDMKPDRKVFTSPDELAQHVQSVFGNHMPKVAAAQKPTPKRTLNSGGSDKDGD